jgi:hypothetical protein
VTIRCPDAEWDERNAMQPFSDLVNHGANYIKNLPSRITCSPLNQTSKLRPTQSM